MDHAIHMFTLNESQIAQSLNPIKCVQFRKAKRLNCFDLIWFFIRYFLFVRLVCSKLGTPHHSQTERMKPTTEKRRFDNSIKWYCHMPLEIQWNERGTRVENLNICLSLPLTSHIQFGRRYTFKIFKEKEEEKLKQKKRKK